MRILAGVAILLVACPPAFCQLNKSKPTGRACVALVNATNGEEQNFRTASVAGQNQKLVAHLDATADCAALVAPFLKSGQLVRGWRPQFADLRPGSELLLPKAPGVWSWEQDPGSIEIYVLFFAPGSRDVPDIRALVKAMQDNRDEGVLKLQANKLRELIGRVHFDKSAAQRAPKPVAEVAGVMRMVVGFEWRDSASAANFSTENPGVLVFPSIASR